jgi:hypothetical protein
MTVEFFRVGTVIVFCLILTLMRHGSRQHGLLCLSYSNLNIHVDTVLNTLQCLLLDDEAVCSDCSDI